MSDVKVTANNIVLLSQVKWCASYWERLRGLMFCRSLGADEGLVLVERKMVSAAAASIHMLAVPFNIAAIWLDGDCRVVHTALARPWRLYYAPLGPAQYVLEGPPDLLQRIAVGDQLQFEPQAGPPA